MVKSSKNFNNNISNFLAKIRAEEGVAKNTIFAYQKDLELFLEFLKNKKLSLQKVSSINIKEYLENLHHKNLSSASISRKISSLKNFYRFLENENIIKTNPLLNIKSPKKEAKLPKSLAFEDISKMLNFAKNDNSEFGIKLSTMLEILYASGLRVSELVSLKMNNLQEITNQTEKSLRNYLIIKGKGNKERIAPLNNESIKQLLKYLSLRKNLGLQNSIWLFPGNIRSKKQQNVISINSEKTTKKTILKDNHITRQRFHQMLKELALKSGVDSSKVHPHVIRHSFATHLLNNGIDLRVLQELLGHSDISSTEIYTHIIDSKLKNLVFNHHPLAKNNK